MRLRRIVLVLSIIIPLAITPTVNSQSFDPNIAKAVSAGSLTWIPARFNTDNSDDVMIFSPSDGCFWKWYGIGSPVTKRWNFQAQRCLGGKPNTVENARIIPMDFNGDTLTDLLILSSDGKCYWKWYSTNTIGPDFNYRAQCCIGKPCSGD